MEKLRCMLHSCIHKNGNQEEEEPYVKTYEQDWMPETDCVEEENKPETIPENDNNVFNIVINNPTNVSLASGGIINKSIRAVIENNCNKEIVEEDGHSNASEINHVDSSTQFSDASKVNHVDSSTQFSDASIRPSYTETMIEATQIPDSQLFGGDSGQTYLSAVTGKVNIDDRITNTKFGQNGLAYDQNDDLSGQNMPRGAADGDSDEETKVKVSDLVEEDIELDTEPYSSPITSDMRPLNSLNIAEKKRIDGSAVTNVINRMSEIGTQSMQINFSIAMTGESNEAIKIDMGKEIGHTGRSVAKDMANVAIQCFQAY